MEPSLMNMNGFYNPPPPPSIQVPIRITDAASAPTQGIKITVHDVKSGKGHGSTKHPGNRYYLKMIEEQMGFYRSQRTDEGKGAVTKLIIDLVECRSPPGRFVEQNKTTKQWEIMPRSRILRKVKQALRDRSASTMAYKRGDLSSSSSLMRSAAGKVGTKASVDGFSKSIREPSSPPNNASPTTVSCGETGFVVTPHKMKTDCTHTDTAFTSSDYLTYETHDYNPSTDKDGIIINEDTIVLVRGVLKRLVSCLDKEEVNADSSPSLVHHDQTEDVSPSLETTKMVQEMKTFGHNELKEEFLGYISGEVPLMPIDDSIWD